MRALYTILALMMAPLCAAAQETCPLTMPAPGEDGPYMTVEPEEDEEYLNGMVPVAPYEADLPEMADSLHLPTLDQSGRMPSERGWRYPYLGSAMGWNLHEGLNMSMDLSAFASFGKGHFSGTAERISLMYARALTKNLSIAVGGYFSNLNSGIGNFRSAGITAILDYRFNEHWEAYIFAQKSLMHNGSDFRYGPYYLMDVMDPYGSYGDRIGAGVRYNFNPSTYIEVQFDWEQYPETFHQSLSNRVMPTQTSTPR